MCDILLIFMLAGYPKKFPKKKKQKYIRKILHDSKTKGNKFSSLLLTFEKTFITKCVEILFKNVAAFFIRKYWQNLLQNVAASLLQNASMLLQNAAGMTERVDY